MTTFFIIVTIALVALAAWIFQKRKERRENIAAALAELGDFNPKYEVYDEAWERGIAVDPASERVALIRCEIAHPIIRVYEFSQVISCEVEEDGKTITKSRRGSQVGGALVGGALFGGVGAVIGGLSGKREENVEVESLRLRVVVNDIDSPEHDVALLSMKAKKGSMFYKDAAKKASEWHARFSAIVRHGENTSSASVASP